jgi:hypothetical protein
LEAGGEGRPFERGGIGDLDGARAIFGEGEVFCWGFLGNRKVVMPSFSEWASGGCGMLEDREPGGGVTFTAELESPRECRFDCRQVRRRAE